MENNELNNVQTEQPVIENPTPTPVEQPVVESPAPTPIVEPVPNSTPEPVVEQPKKKKNGALVGIIILLILVGAGVFLFLNKDKFFGSGEIKTPKKMSEVYVDNLIKKKYDDNYQYVYIVDDTFIVKNDYLDFVQKYDKYSELASKKVESVEEKLKTETDATYLFNLVTSEGQKSTMEIKLKSVDDKWKVVEDSFYLTNWEFVALKDAKVTINDIEVPKKYIKEDTSLQTYQVRYVIPAITSTEKKLVLETKIGKNEETVTPLGSNSGTKYGVYLTDADLTSRAREYIKTAWNNMYQDYLKNTDINTIKEKYFDEHVDIENVNKYYTLGFKSLTSSTVKSAPYKNFKMLEVVPWPDKQNFVYANDIIGLNFGYKLSWTWDYSFIHDDDDMSRYSSIILKLDGDSFKIYQVTDEKLFTWANSFTHEYK